MVIAKFTCDLLGKIGWLLCPLLLQAKIINEIIFPIFIGIVNAMVRPLIPNSLLPAASRIYCMTLHI